MRENEASPLNKRIVMFHRGKKEKVTVERDDERKAPRIPITAHAS